MYVNIGNDSREFFIVWRDSSKRDPVGMVASAHKRFPLAAWSTRNLTDFGPQQFLNLDDVEMN